MLKNSIHAPQIRRIGFCSVPLLLLLSGAASAADGPNGAALYNPSLTFVGGIGVIDITANEIVYRDTGSSTKNSQLIWESTAPLASAEITARSDSGWTARLSGQGALEGGGFMRDYDWVAEFTNGNSLDDWSDRSVHPATTLDHYYSASLALGHDFQASDNLLINLNGGVSYASVKWSAKGGSFTYSESAFRDTNGEVEDDTVVIGYEQTYPVAFAGIDTNYTAGAWTFGAAVKGGFTFSASDLDNHWVEEERTNTKLDPAPVLTLAGSVGYKVNDSVTLFASGSYEKIFRGRGDIYPFDTSTGTPYDTYRDGGGADFSAATLTFGVKASF